MVILVTNLAQGFVACAENIGFVIGQWSRLITLAQFETGRPVLFLKENALTGWPNLKA